MPSNDVQKIDFAKKKSGGSWAGNRVSIEFSASGREILFCWVAFVGFC